MAKNNKSKKEEVKREVVLKLSFPERSYYYGGKIYTGKKEIKLSMDSQAYKEMKASGRIGKKGEAAFYIVKDK